MTQIPHITLPILNGIKHGFFGRKGGVSHAQPGFETLNVGMNKGDNIDDIVENRRRICQQFGLTLDGLVIVNQQHTDVVHIVDRPFENIPVGDALVTTKPNLLLGIQTADCVPVLFADCENQVVAGAHAGWRGAVKGILESTLDKMIEVGANRSNIKVALGPCIWQSSYEVGPDFVQAMKDHPGAYRPEFFIPGNRVDHFYFDLPGYVMDRLKKAGVKHITPSPFNTFANPEDFFSYRYKTIHQLPYLGLQLSVIRL